MQDGVTRVTDDDSTPVREMSNYPTPPPSREGTPVDGTELERVPEQPLGDQLTDIRSLESVPTGSVPANPRTVSMMFCLALVPY